MRISLLVNEDVHDDAELLVINLERQGFEIDWQRVETAIDLKESLIKGGWDAIISDFMLDGFTGFDALEIAKEYAPDLPFIIISGTVGEEIAVEVMRRGAHDYIMKDNLTRLGEALRREMREAKIRIQHREAEHKLRERESQLNSILSASPLGIGTLHHRKLTFVNEKVCQVLGYSKDELLGLDIEVLYENKEDYSRVGIVIYNNLADVGNVYTRFVTKEGKLVHVNFNYSIVSRKENILTFTVEDISDKIEAEEALEESRRRYKSLYTLLRTIGENMPDMIWAKDLNKNYIYANPAICKDLLSAKNAEEPLGKNDLFFAQRERDSHPEADQWHTFGEICVDSDEIVMNTKEAGRFDEFGNVKGEFVFLDVYKAPLYDESGKFIGTVGSARDITQQREIQLQLEESEKKYRTLIQNQGEGLFIVDENENITFANPAASRIYEMPVKDLIGKNLGDFVDEQTFEKFVEQTETRRKELKSSTFEFPIHLPSGKSKTLLATVSPYLDDDNTFIGIFGIFRDISKRVKLEEELRKAKEKAEETDRLKSAFLANMSHEIRTPMNSIIGFSDLLTDGSVSEDQQHYYLDIINKNGEHLLQLIDDIIDIAKIESNELAVVKKPFDLHGLLLETEHNFADHTLVVEKGLVFGLDNIQPGSKLIHSDEFRIKQVLYNLIQNALKFTNSGSVHFGYLEPGNGELLFYVKDTGSGIEDKYQESIFSRFEQGNPESAIQHGGTGLGLSICKGIAKLLGGKLWLKSELGKGTVFYFSIPIVTSTSDTSAISQASVSQINSFDFSKYTILVAEDKAMNLLLFEQILKSKGVKLYHAPNGKRAVELLDEHTEIDMVIMDIKMPVMDGLEASKIIKGKKQNLPIMAVTAYAMSEDKDKALAAGCDDYLTKPITKAALLEKVVALLS